MIFLRIDLNSFLNVKSKKKHKKHVNFNKIVTNKNRKKRMNICLRNPFVRIYIFSVNLFKILRTFSNFFLLFSLINILQ